MQGREINQRYEYELYLSDKAWTEFSKENNSFIFLDPNHFLKLSNNTHLGNHMYENTFKINMLSAKICDACQ